MKLLTAASVLLAAVWLSGQTRAQPPRIQGIAHLAVFVSDLNAARGFYRDFLGLEETVIEKRADGSADVADVADVVVMAINGRQ
jgi:hypothetical protein